MYQEGDGFVNIASFWAAFFVVLGGIIGKLIDYLIGRQKNKLENVEKGEGLFLLRISFPLPFFPHDFHRKEEIVGKEAK
jgi:membrane protein DedA with SNARE-associated domain